MSCCDKYLINDLPMFYEILTISFRDYPPFNNCRTQRFYSHFKAVSIQSYCCRKNQLNVYFLSTLHNIQLLLLKWNWMKKQKCRIINFLSHLQTEIEMAPDPTRKYVFMTLKRHIAVIIWNKSCTPTSIHIHPLTAAMKPYIRVRHLENGDQISMFNKNIILIVFMTYYVSFRDK